MNDSHTTDRLINVADLIIRAWRQGYQAEVLTENGQVTLLELTESLRFLRRLGVRRRDYC